MDPTDFDQCLHYRLAYELAAAEADRRDFSVAQHGGRQHDRMADVERVVALVLARFPEMAPEQARDAVTDALARRRPQL
jgi:hypothetical protein